MPPRTWMHSCTHDTAASVASDSGGGDGELAPRVSEDRLVVEAPGPRPRSPRPPARRRPASGRSGAQRPGTARSDGRTAGGAWRTRRRRRRPSRRCRWPLRRRARPLGSRPTTPRQARQLPLRRHDDGVGTYPAQLPSEVEAVDGGDVQALGVHRDPRSCLARGARLVLPGPSTPMMGPHPSRHNGISTAGDDEVAVRRRGGPQAPQLARRPRSRSA